MSYFENSVEKLTKKKYLIDYYYDNFIKFYEKKAFAKASEYLWGVFNNLSTAIALFYGHDNLNHAQIISFIKQLSITTDIPDMIEQLSVMNSLHANYYHDFMSEDDFEINKNEALKLLETLKEILNEFELKLENPKK